LNKAFHFFSSISQTNKSFIKTHSSYLRKTQSKSVSGEEKDKNEDFDPLIAAGSFL